MRGIHRIALVGAAAFAMAMGSSSGAMAGCTGLPGGNVDPLTIFGTTEATSLISTINTVNTAFLTQTTAFISAPPNPKPNQPGGGIWVRGVGGKVKTDSDTSLNWSFGTAATSGTTSCSDTITTNFSGVQVGSDYARLNVNGWNLHLGTTAGYSESKNTTGNTEIKAQAPFGGVYAAATKGGFFIDGQLIGTYYDLATTDSSVGVSNQHTGAYGIGFAGSLGYNFRLKNNWFVEPSAGIVWSHTKVDSIAAAPLVGPTGGNAPATVSVDDVDSTLGHIGVRIGTSVLRGNLALQPFVAASVWHEFASDATANVTTNCYPSGFYCTTVTGHEYTISQSSSRVGTYGQYALGVAGTILNTGWLGYVRGDYRNGSNIDGWSVNGGIRYQFTPKLAGMPGKHPIYKAPPPPPTYNWTGFYLGASGGITYGDADWFYPGYGTSLTERYTGGLFGGQIGYNRQFGKWVLGIEADDGWTNAIGGKSCPNANFFTCQVKLKWLASVTGRVGYTFWSDRILTYVKGGFAAGSVTAQTVFNLGAAIPPSGTDTNGTTSTATGWTIGLGTEVGLTDHWSAKGEYMYYDLGSKDYTVDNDLVVSVHPRGSIVRVGLNYHFGPR